MTDAICREGICHAAHSLRRAYENGMDKDAREGTSLASLFSGMALANSALGAVHGFAGPLGGMLHAPHGAICAKLLPLVMEANLKAMISREPNHPASARYGEVAQILTGDKNASASDGVQWLSDLVRDLNIPMLSVYGMTSERFSEAAEKTMKASSTNGNPIVLSDEEALAAGGAVLFLEMVSPALERVDSSSGAIGTAVNHAIDRQGPDRRVAVNTNDPVSFMRRPLYGACPPQPPISPATRCSHENFATVSVPNQCSSPAPKAKRNLIIDAMAIFAGQ